MNRLLASLFVVHALACSAFSQTTNVLRDKNSRFIESLKVPSGKTLTIESGGSIINNGTATGFTTGLAIGTSAITGGTSGHILYNNAGTLGGIDLSAVYQPLNTNITTIAALANGAGVLTNNGGGTFSYTATSNGGNGDADAGKIPLLSTHGGLNLGAYDVVDGNIITVRTGYGYGIAVGVAGNGQGIYSELNDSFSQAFHAHVTSSSTGAQTAYDADLTGGSGINYGLALLCNASHFPVYFRERNAGTGVGHDRFTIDAQGDHTWYADGTTLSTGTNKTSLLVETPSGTGAYTLKAGRTGDIVSTGDTGTVTNTMLAGSIALSKLATTGTASASTYLRGDGAWTAIDLSGYLPLAGGTMTGVITASAGSVSAPSITFTGATSNTGIYSTGTDTIDFAINGVRRVYIDVNGTIQTSGSGIQITNGNMISNGNYFSRGGGYYLGASDNCNISTGTGSPEGVVTAKVGSLYLRSDGGASTTLYVKESGTGNTGWVAK